MTKDEAKAEAKQKKELINRFMGSMTNGEYRKDWNLLMTVVDRIESLGYSFEITRTDIAIRPYADENAFIFCYGVKQTKKEATYNGVVEFIEWWNENEKK